MVTKEGCNPTQWRSFVCDMLFNFGSERGSTKVAFYLLSPSVVSLELGLGGIGLETRV